MTLPITTLPIYELQLPSNNKIIKYRPFTVKEKKLFLIVREAKEAKDVVNTIKQVIKNCIVQPVDFDVDNMAIIDIEMLFVHLRARSEGEVQELEFECNNILPDSGKQCKAISKVSFNLLDVKAERTDNHTNIIPLTEKMGVAMKYPTYAMSQILTEDNPSTTQIIDIIVDCIDYVYDSDKMYYAKDEKKEDLKAWFDGLTAKNFEQIMAFFESSPKIVGKSNFVCHKCGYQEEIKLSGIQDFFG